MPKCRNAKRKTLQAKINLHKTMRRYKNGRSVTTSLFFVCYVNCAYQCAETLLRAFVLGLKSQKTFLHVFGCRQHFAAVKVYKVAKFKFGQSRFAEIAEVIGDFVFEGNVKQSAA